MSNITGNQTVRIRVPVEAKSTVDAHKVEGLIAFDTTSRAIAVCPGDGLDYVRAATHPDDLTPAGSLAPANTVTVVQDGVQRRASVSQLLSGAWQPEDADLTAIAAIVEVGTLRRVDAGDWVVDAPSRIGLVGADPTGTEDCTAILQNAIDTCAVGTTVVLVGTYRTTAMIVGRGGVSVEIPKGSQVHVDHSGYAFHIKPGFSLLGTGIIRHLQPSSGCLLMAPTASVPFSISNCPVVGDLVLQSSSDTSPSGIGIHWDMTLQSGSFAKIGNVVIRGWDTAEGFTIPAGKYITSVYHKAVSALYCRAYIDSTAHIGQLAGFSYAAVHVQPYKPTGGTQEYGIRLDNAGFFVISDLLLWDWESTTPAPLQKIWLGSNTYDMDFTTPTTRSYQTYNAGRNNCIRYGATSTVPPAISRMVNVQGSNDSPGFAGCQDDFLALADRRYTVTMAGALGGYTADKMFNGNPTNYTRFTGDGTFKSVEIDLGASVKVHTIGVGSPAATAPSEVRISVYYGGAWYVVYNSTAADGFHVTHTGLYRTAISRIRIEASKSSNFDITEIFAYSSQLWGNRFIQTNGMTYMYDDLTFATDAAGRGLSLVDLTLGNRKRLFLDGGVLSLEDCGIGYAAGKGGAVTQGTSKSTGVSLDAFCGDITMNNAALNPDTTVSFVLTNPKVSASDHVVISHASVGSLGSYIVTAYSGSGSATIYVRNITGGALSEAIHLKFTVIKGATS